MMSELSQAFLRALFDAGHYHHEQKRKSTDIPYISYRAACTVAIKSGTREQLASLATYDDVTA